MTRRGAQVVGVTLAVLLLSSTTIGAEIRRNAGKYGTMFGWPPFQGTLPPTNLYPPTIRWDIRDQAWWNEVIRQATQAGFGWLAADSWGQGIKQGDPADLGPLLTAIDANGGAMKIALFDDT